MQSDGLNIVHRSIHGFHLTRTHTPFTTGNSRRPAPPLIRIALLHRPDAAVRPSGDRIVHDRDGHGLQGLARREGERAGGGAVVSLADNVESVKRRVREVDDQL